MGSLAIPSELHFVKGIDPVADMNNGTVYSDIIEVGGEGIMFLYYKGVLKGWHRCGRFQCNPPRTVLHSWVPMAKKRPG